MTTKIVSKEELLKVEAKYKEKNLTKDEVEKKLVYQRDKDKELVKGVFKDYEVPGGSLGFMYKKYKGDKLQKYVMQDGGVYTIPLGVAKHLNSNCWYPVHNYAVNEEGKPVQRISQKVKRYGFQSLDFMEIEEFDRGGKQIIEVENMAIKG